MAVRRPVTRAMPSPTSLTTEASWRSTMAPMESSWSRRMSMIVVELIPDLSGLVVLSVIAHHSR